MTNIRTNKPDAARRQIDTAIQLLFSNGDPVSIHTLAAAGFRILRDLAEKSRHVTMHQVFKQMIKPGMETKFWAAINETANFLKHADKDPDAILENFNEIANDYTIFFACLYYETLGFSLAQDMRAFMAWFAMMHPNYIIDGHPAKQLAATVYNRERTATRAEQLNLGGLFLRVAKTTSAWPVRPWVA